MLANSAKAPPKLVRCAVYTRKSTEEGLKQDFNSLDAQRDSAEAYVRSQAGEGWTPLPARFDDGGYTGANMERPALARLLADIEAGSIDCVVVYKVDRLSRSIRDFAKMMDLFDKHHVSFVAVTQPINTTTSMGRLMLNILLSFAQFEREMTSERTRDKVVAARRKGRWTGGHIPLGYDLDPQSRKLVINHEEAEQVREIFRLYLEGTAVQEIAGRLDRLGWRSKQWTTGDGKLSGGTTLRRCHIYGLLGNLIYSGRVRAGEEVVPGEHGAIIDQQTFDLVQARLKQNTCSDGHRSKTEALLRGMLYCSCCGSGMYGTYSVAHGRRYRYYVCHRAQQKLDVLCRTKAVSAQSVEAAVFESIRRVGIHPEVLAETAFIAQQRLAESLTSLRNELAAANAQAKNLRSQVVRSRKPTIARDELVARIAQTDACVAELRSEIQRRGAHQIDEQDLRKTMQSFECVWTELNIDEQRALLGRLVGKVGYDGRTDKVTVSFKSAAAKDLIMKGAA